MKRLLPQLVVLTACFLASVLATSQTQIQQQFSESGIEVVFPNDEAYANASQIYNLRYTYKPFAVAYPTSTNQVSKIVKIGVQHGLNIAARSGGHSYIANGLGGKNGSVVVDLSKLKKITYDSSTGIAEIETGNRLGDVALGLDSYGRGLPHGRCPYVGLGGHSGYGGFGYIGRKWGLTLDTIRSATVVLADGKIVTVSENQHPELFWAIRGSSPSFGIVTSVKFQTFPSIPTTTIYLYSWDLSAEEAVNSFLSWQDFTSPSPSSVFNTTIPLELGGELLLLKGSAPGRVAVWLFGGYYGPLNQFNNTIGPFLSTFPSIPEPTMLTQGDWRTGLEAVAFGVGPLNTSSQPDTNAGFYAKSLMTPEKELVTKEAAEKLVDYLANVAYYSPFQWDIEIELFGGPGSAINAPKRDDTAFAHRDSRFNLQFFVVDVNYTSGAPWSQEAFDVLDGMVDALRSGMPANWDVGAYPNYIDDRLEDWQKLYYGPHFDRLENLKKVVDPHDVFKFPITVQ